MTEQVTASARPKLSVRAGVSRKLLERKAAEKAAGAAPEGGGVEDCFPSAGPVGADHAAEEARGPFCALHDQYLSDRMAERDAVLAAKVAVQSDVQGATEPHAQFAGEPHGRATNTPPATPAAATQEPASAPPAHLASPPATQPPAAAPWRDEDESAYQTLLARRTAAGCGRRGRTVTDQLIGLGAIKPNPDTVVAVIVGLVAERGGNVPRGELVAAMTDAKFPHPKAQPTDRGWCQGYIAGAVRSGFLSAAAEPAVAAAA